MVRIFAKFQALKGRYITSDGYSPSRWPRRPCSHR